MPSRVASARIPYRESEECFNEGSGSNAKCVSCSSIFEILQLTRSFRLLSAFELCFAILESIQQIPKSCHRRPSTHHIIRQDAKLSSSTLPATAFINISSPRLSTFPCPNGTFDRPSCLHDASVRPYSFSHCHALICFLRFSCCSHLTACSQDCR